MHASRLLVVPVLLILAVGCHSFPPWSLIGEPSRAERSYQPPPPPGYPWLDVPYSDSEAFDTLLDCYLQAGKPAIRIVLDTKEPDWLPRMNAWLKAYQAGGQVRQPTGKGGLDSLLWLAGMAQTPSDARQLLETAFDHLETYVKAGLAWWNDEQQRRRRIDLLKPYNLDAVRESRRGDKYSILLCNGRYESEPAK